ncbi:DUF397 domain-containing protein [Actinomadura sp. 6K520]|uniref:DUF397 domain-containing protein n=1 Tax=Actinomadura sp. 6K520 TaxID=2530364 RepID=UPI00104EF5FB|nr:DUF397 domain-containing protein [Actinomadura sp. 6K520]TDE28384.1 DUF397 domain-containing protein [Actinomadura sp. 6K520]
MDGPALWRAQWCKSSHSKASSNCVEVAGLRPGIGIRDGKSPAGPVLVVTRAEWAVFVNAVNAGEYDLD